MAALRSSATRHAAALLRRGAAAAPTACGTGRRAVVARGVHVEARLEELGIVLPPPGGPKANYTSCQRDGDLLYISGQLPAMDADGTLVTGTVGPAGQEGCITLEEGYQVGHGGTTQCHATPRHAVPRRTPRPFSPRHTPPLPHQSARWCGLNIVATIKGELGDLDR